MSVRRFANGNRSPGDAYYCILLFELNILRRGFMNLGDLKAFVAVAETGSINRAAAKLNLTQPAVTRRVQSLEATIGVPLLDRSSKPPSLTEDGHRALAHGRKVLSAIEDLSLQVGSKRGLSGEFRIAIPPAFPHPFLGRPLDHLMRNFPKITLPISS